MTSAVEAYKSLEKDLFALLAKSGFKKRKSKFQLYNNETIVVLGLQKSRSSTASSIKFTINASVYAKRILDPEYDDIENLLDYDGHCYWRIGDMLTIHRDLWWMIDDAIDSAETHNDVLSVGRDTMLPFLASFASERAVLELWQSGSCPGRSEKQRLQYLSALQAL
jgi:Domain of unknown function (DUF4304)